MKISENTVSRRKPAGRAGLHIRLFIGFMVCLCISFTMLFISLSGEKAKAAGDLD